MSKITVMNSFIKSCSKTITAGLILYLLLHNSWSQQTIKPAWTGDEKSGWYPASVHWSPQGTDLLVSACPKVRNPSTHCTLFRYQLQAKRWESLLKLPSAGKEIYDDAVYSPDAGNIVAVETGQNCPECNGGIGSRLVLLTADGERVRYLTPHGFRIMPTFSRDGKKLIYWKSDISTLGRTPIGLFDAWELDLETNTERRLTNFLASEIEAPPRYWPDGERIMLVASDYTRTPNLEDFRSKDGKNYVAYISKFHRNGTVVTKPNGQMVRPYFLPSENIWLLVKDISPDGKTVIYSDRTKCIKIKKIAAPSEVGDCIGPLPNELQVAAYSPEGNKVASIWGSIDVLYRLGVLNLQTGKVDFIDLAW